jgi:hypothetical protein
MKTIKMLLLAGLAAISLSSQASYLTLDTNGQFYNIVNSNNFTTELGGSGTLYNIGANVLFSVAGNYEITFTALAQESGFFNSLTAYGSTLNETPSGTSFTVSVNVSQINELLAFAFKALNNNSTEVGTGIANGGNQPFASAQSFATILNGAFDGTSYDAILLWDDSGANQDDNHDDMIVGVSINAVSAPTTLAILGLGLFALGLSRRKNLI